jgi:diaminopimelate epimerase
MHGLGNDFVVFDARGSHLALDRPSARALADRRFGVGCDQVIVIGAGRGGIDAVMRIYNADGGEVESCGNAARCVAGLLMDESGRDTVRLDTVGGALTCTRAENGLVTVDIGEPRLMWDQVPLAKAADTNLFRLNVVLFVDDADSAPVAELGPRIETHPMFPARTNVEFVSLHRDANSLRATRAGRLRMRVWERGVGITSACGTGACAVAVAAFRRGLTGRKVEIVLDGGSLFIELRESDEHILMTGPATLAFRGEVDIEALRP